MKHASDLLSTQALALKDTRWERNNSRILKHSAQLAHQTNYGTNVIMYLSSLLFRLPFFIPHSVLSISVQFHSEIPGLKNWYFTGDGTPEPAVLLAHQEKKQHKFIWYCKMA